VSQNLTIHPPFIHFQIQPDAFRSGPVPLLQHLDISSNRLSDVPSGLPEGLIHLDAASNQFRQIPDSIAQLAGLTRLNLSGNEIRQAKIVK
jgi:Leucine-rich repeat (LRR) protein